MSGRDTKQLLQREDLYCGAELGSIVITESLDCSGVVR